MTSDQATTWVVDPARSTIGFSLRHLLISTVRGRFTGFEGATTASAAGQMHASGSVRVSTIDTGDEIRDKQLLGPEFFDEASNPEIRFASTSMELIDGELLRVVGNLAIKGATHQIELRAQRTGAARDRIELDMHGVLRRSDFGIESAQLLEAGISDKVELALHIVLVGSPEHWSSLGASTLVSDDARIHG